MTNKDIEVIPIEQSCSHVNAKIASNSSSNAYSFKRQSVDIKHLSTAHKIRIAKYNASLLI